MTNDPQALEKLQRKGKKPVTDRTDALELARLLLLADNIVAHGSNIAYPSRASAQNVRNVVRELAAALRAAPQPAGLPTRCDRCGSSGDTFVLCAGCHSPTTEEAMFMLQDVPGATLVERVARLSKWYLELTASNARSADQITAGAAWLAENVLRMKWIGLRENGRAMDDGFNPWVAHNARQEDYRDAVRGILAAMESAKPDESYEQRKESGAEAFDPELQADGDAEKLILDQRRLDWLQERIVDTIYLDDGKIIDVRGGNLRDAVDGAMKPAPEDQGDDRLGERGS